MMQDNIGAGKTSTTMKSKQMDNHMHTTSAQLLQDLKTSWKLTTKYRTQLRIFQNVLHDQRNMKPGLEEVTHLAPPQHWSFVTSIRSLLERIFFQKVTQISFLKPLLQHGEYNMRRTNQRRNSKAAWIGKEILHQSNWYKLAFIPIVFVQSQWYWQATVTDNRLH